MKKITFMILTALLAVSFTACKDNDEPKITDGEITNGFYVLNQGNMSGNIAASITAYNSSTGESTGALEDAFFKANGVAIGESVQQAVVCADKMFIAMYSSNLIWVVEPSTLKIITSIRPEGDAVSPRALTVANGRVYCSMYTGYVCEIDPDACAITRTVKVGPNPEQMGVIGNTLVVANSDGMNYYANYADCSLSFVDLISFKQTELKDYDKICNPTKCASNGKDLFIICMGNYFDIPAKIIKVTGKTIEDIKDVCLGSSMSINGNNLYVVNNQISKEFNCLITYKVYDTSTLEEHGDFVKMTEDTDSWIDYPISIFTNPQNGEIVVLSNILDGKDAVFTAPCYANLYDNKGNFIRRIPCGVCATEVTFVYKD